MNDFAWWYNAMVWGRANNPSQLRWWHILEGEDQ